MKGGHTSLVFSFSEAHMHWQCHTLTSPIPKPHYTTGSVNKHYVALGRSPPLHGHEFQGHNGDHDNSQIEPTKEGKSTLSTTQQGCSYLLCATCPSCQQEGTDRVCFVPRRPPIPGTRGSRAPGTVQELALMK